MASRLVYPEPSRLAASEGTADISFVVDKNGELTNVEVLKSSGDVLLDAEALRVVRTSPKWTPGMMKGKPVKVTYVLPAIFRLK